MSRVLYDHQCPGCQTRNLVRVPRPSFLEPSHTSYRCAVCESEVHLEIVRIPGDKRVEINARTFMSKMLMDAIEEEQEERNRP